MSTKEIGEPAFLRNYDSDGHNGMTLRDYFAAMSLCHSYSTHDTNADKAAEWAYELADAMLEARK